MASCLKCYGCIKPEWGDRVRDSSGQLGYGSIWVLNGDGTAFVQFGWRGPIDIRISQLEFVERRYT
jgi:hypothetical protein